MSLPTDDLREKIGNAICDGMERLADPHDIADAILALLPSRNDVIEKCAQVADRQAESHAHNANVAYADPATPEKHRFASTVSSWIASGIRTLKDPT